MSTIVAQTLSNGTVSTSTNNCIRGSARAWVQYNGGTTTINGSFNVSSVTYNASGNYTINFTTAIGNANYAPVVACNNINAETKIQFGTIASGSLQILSQGSVNVGSPYNPVLGCAVFSS
jgi:PKD repeat protein